jgi:hypothetical protein
MYAKSSFLCVGAFLIAEARHFFEEVRFPTDLNADLREKISAYYPFKVKTFKVQILVWG